LRKPFTVRETLDSNSIGRDEIAELRRVGSVTNDPYPLADPEAYPNEQLRLGAKVFRFQCSVCHTREGTNGLSHLMGTWTTEQKRLNIAKLQRTKAFMPPFAGNARELEALVRLVEWTVDGRPSSWPEGEPPEVLAQIERWLEEAGTEPRVESGPERGARR
jgi:mono/diheme cytochrome c family protein